MHYNKSDLPLDKEMLNFWNDNGYLIIEDFKTHEECDELINRSKKLIEEQDFNNQQSVFDTVSQSHNDDNYFLESGDKIRFFFEEKANLDEENVKNNKQYIVNKIGHALHDLDDKFIAFSKKILRLILLQSIFSQFFIKLIISFFSSSCIFMNHHSTKCSFFLCFLGNLLERCCRTT